MSLLSDIQAVLSPLGIPVETGVFTDKAPTTYLVVVPMTEDFAFFADNLPQVDVQEARIALYTKTNYQAVKRQLVSAFLTADFTITQRSYIGYEPDTGYHHFNIDVARYYDLEE